jgi:hypothetical protein
MNKNNNKGSSLVLVIVLFAVLFTICGASLLVLNTNYRIRVKEGKRLQNLYESEAGLDIAYNVLAKTFEVGVEAGRDAVDNIPKGELDNLDSAKKKGEKINEIFQAGFKSVVTSNEIKTSIEGHKYIKDYKYDDNVYRYQVVKFKNNSDVEPKLECINPKLEDNVYEIKVISEFKSDKKDSSTGENLRKIQVTYQLKVPDYEDSILSDSSEKVVYPEELKGKVIGVDGNMDIKNSSPLAMNLTGDIFVKGHNDTNSNNYRRVYDKYNGGITLDTNSSLAFTLKGDIITANTFNIANKGGSIHTSMQQGDVYAGNIYVGSKDGGYAGSSQTDIRSVVVDNDLAMKGKGSILNIDNFYGINDKNLFNTEFSQENNFQTKTRNSSSIIVNGGTGSINIKDSAYIMGTAYIDAQNSNGSSYQTGESVAIKGNYVAYTKPLDEFKNYDFENYGPLQLVDSDGNGTKLNINQKSEYFKAFVESDNQGDIKTGNVNLPLGNTHSIGALVYKQNNNLVVEKGNFNENMNRVIDDERIKYAKNVYCMGDSTESESELENIYNELGKYQKTVANTVKFDNIKENFISSELVLNKNPDKTIVITDSSYTGSGDEIVIKVDSNKDFNKLIITNGNVKVMTRLMRTYKGAIISTKDIMFDSHGGAGELIMKYDEKVINEIIAKNQDKLKGVFNSSASKKIDNRIQGITTTHTYQYDVKKYITSKNWKILR